VPHVEKSGLLLPLYIVLSMSPDIRQQAKSKRSAYCGSSSAFKYKESPPKAPFSWSMLSVDYNATGRKMNIG
jgi:hypothetical protein